MSCLSEFVFFVLVLVAALTLVAVPRYLPENLGRLLVAGLMIIGSFVLWRVMGNTPPARVSPRDAIAIELILLAVVGWVAYFTFRAIPYNLIKYDGIDAASRIAVHVARLWLALVVLVGASRFGALSRGPKRK